MQAHAGDLRAEIANDWESLFGRRIPRTPDARAPHEADAAALDARVHELVRDWRAGPLTEPTGALLAYVEKLTRSAASCTAADVQMLREAGWSDRAVHDAVQVAAYFNYINRVADALGVPPEPDLPTWGAP